MKTFLMSAVVLAAAISTTADAEHVVTYKSAKNTSSYYQMAVQIAEAMKKGSNSDIIVTVEESQGLFKTSRKRRNVRAIMCSPPCRCWSNWRKRAWPCSRAKPIPNTTKSVPCFNSFAYHAFHHAQGSRRYQFRGPGWQDHAHRQGSFGAREGAKYLKLFGLEGKVKLATVELNAM